MSKGNPRVIFRMSEELLAEVRERIGSRNATSRESPWTLTDYLLHVIREDLRHRKASNAPRPGRKSRKRKGVIQSALTPPAPGVIL